MLALIIPWQYPCREDSEPIKNKDMLLNYYLKDDGVELDFNAIGVKKKNIEIKGRPNNQISVIIPESNYRSRQTGTYIIPDEYDIQKAEARCEDGILTIKVPYRKDRKEVKIDVD